MCPGARCPGSRCGGLDRVERGQGEGSLCGVVVCGLGLCSLVWVVWLAGARVLRLAGSWFSELVVSCGAVPLRRAMGAARVVWLGYDSVGLGCTFWVGGRCAVRPDRRIRLSFCSCLVRCAWVGVAALVLVVVLRGLVRLWVPSGCVPAALWLVGCRTAASLGLGTARAALLVLGVSWV